MEVPLRAAIEAVWRVEAPRLKGGLVRLARDLDVAEDLAQDALLSALERWPETGIPENPGAWLMLTAKNRYIDQVRRRRMVERKHEAEGPYLESSVPDAAFESDENVGDDVLRLVLIACHPIVPAEGRVALTLRLLGGMSTEEIARAFLTPEPTIAQRIVRAKKTLAAARVPFDVPKGRELEERLGSVIEVIYLIFNEGYAATRGESLLRQGLCEDALRLARVLAALAPDDSEVLGLVALLEIQSSRARARVGAAGEPVLLLEQNRGRWDQLLIRRGLAALERAESLACPLGPYALQAAIAACHARARRAEDTDWIRIVALYDALVEVTGSPVVELNRAVAVAMAYGPAEALELVDLVAKELGEYHYASSVRGDLLFKLDRREEARAEFERAASLTKNERERALLLGRARECSKPRILS